MKGRELLSGFFGQSGTVSVFRKTGDFIEEAVYEDELGQSAGGALLIVRQNEGKDNEIPQR